MPQFHLSKSTYNIYKYTAFLSCAVILLLGVVFLQPFASDNSYAADHSDNASGSYNGTTYSLTTTVSDLNLELKNVTPAGKAVYGKQTVNVTTTAPGGYQLYMQTSGNLAGTKDGTATSDSIAALSANNSALDTNSWGYVTASALSSASTTLDEDMNKAATQEVWNTPPSTLTQIDATSSAASSGRDTDIYYGIKADNTLAGDNYSGTITYTTVASDITSSDEATNGLTVTPTSSTANTATTLTITTPLMTTASLTASDIVATVGSYNCTSISITSSTPLTFTCSITPTAAGTYDVTATISKYDKTYTKTSVYTVNEDNTMQKFTAAKCNALTQWTGSTQGSTTTLKDSRDDKTYSVRRLADGHCWMVTNLRLGKTSAMTLSSSDTDITASTWSLPASISSGFNSYTAAQMHIGSTSDNSKWTTSWGNYYNWTAATAGQGTNSTTSGNINVSICPKGWKLPKGEANTVDYSWAKLYNAYSSNVSNFQTATNTGTTSSYWSGYYYNSLLSTTGPYGYWWSRTAGNTNNAYSLGAGSGYVGPQDDVGKSRGFSVRCVFNG